MRTFSAAGWPELQELRGDVTALSDRGTLTEAAQQFCSVFTRRFDTVVLARVFAILPFSSLPPRERQFAQSAAAPAALGDSTPVLCLCGTAGGQPAWNDRTASHGHLAIPLTSSDFVRGAPMIAQLLADLRVNLRLLDDGLPVASRELMGGRSLTFFVPDALTTFNDEGRLIIGAEDFARAHAIRSVFGMAGSYLDGTVVAAIFFTCESLTRATAEKFSTLIATFKLATAHLVQAGLLFGD